MILAQLSDTHIVAKNNTHDKEKLRVESLKRCVDDINNLVPLPDAVIHTGDLTHNGLKEEFKIVFEILNSLKMPWYPTPGNKDRSINLIKNFSNKMTISPNHEFVLYAVDKHNVRLISMDSLSENSNKGNFTKEKLLLLDKLLLEEKQKPTAIFLHHPPFEVYTSIRSFFEYENEESVINFNKVISKHSQLRGIFCGHVHRDYNIVKDNLYTHSVPPLAIDLRYGSYPDNKSNSTLYYLYHYSNKDGFKPKQCWVNV